MRSLEDKLSEYDSPVAMLRANPTAHAIFDYPPEWSNWYNEQWAWRNSCVMFDQTNHMTDTVIKGPDAIRLISDTGVNTTNNLVRGRAKQFVAVGHDGNFIGDALMFGIEDDEFNLVGPPNAGDWVWFNAISGNYNVEVTRDDAVPFNRTGRRNLWRLQLNGPATRAIIERAIGGPLDRIPFFHIGDFEIAGTPVRALNHTMSGTPGDELSGLELSGPFEHKQAVLDALTFAGAELGLQRGGALAYLSSDLESGWIPMAVPAIYTQEEMRPYRQHLIEWSLPALLALEGTFVSDRIEDYYVTPWDLGYGNFIKFDHDFIGRDALERLAAEPHRHKVFLEWNSDDVIDIMRESLFSPEEVRPRPISLPYTTPAALYDDVRVNDRSVGFSTWGGYTIHNRAFVSLASVDEEVAEDGTNVELLWGDTDNGSRPWTMPPTRQATIRATVRSKAPANR